MVNLNEPASTDVLKLGELRKRVKELEEDNEQLAYKLEKTNRSLNRLNIEKQ